MTTAHEIMVRIIVEETVNHRTIFDYPDLGAELVRHLPDIIEALDVAEKVAPAFENMLLHHKQGKSDAAARWALLSRLRESLTKLGFEP